MFFIAGKVARRSQFNDRDGTIVEVNCPHTMSTAMIVGIAIGSLVGQSLLYPFWTHCGTHLCFRS